MTHVALAVLLLSAAPVPSPAGVDTRDDFEQLERLLDAAVQSVSRASAAHVLGVGETCQSYELKGYGAVFVLAPRLLPSEGRVFLFRSGPMHPGAEDALDALRVMEESFNASSDQAIRKEIEAFAREVRLQEERMKAREERPGAGQRRSAAQDVKAIEAQAEAFQREARKAREEAERTVEALRRELQNRFVPSPQGLAAAASDSPPPAPPSGPAVPAPPSPPWQSWFELEDLPDPRPPGVLIRDVRAAITAAVSASGARLRTLRPEDVVVVAVDFFPPGAFGTFSRPARTLVVKARKKDLLEHEAGRTSAEELGRRIEYDEY